jgi:hypothetical protein
MKNRFAFLAALLTLSFSVATHASPITYNLQGQTTDGYSLTGTITFDPSTDLITGGDVTESGSGSYHYTDLVDSSIGTSASDGIIGDSSSGDIVELKLAIDPSSYSAPVLCISGGTGCGGSDYSTILLFGEVPVDPLASATLTSAVP